MSSKQKLTMVGAAVDGQLPFLTHPSRRKRLSPGRSGGVSNGSSSTCITLADEVSPSRPASARGKTRHVSRRKKQSSFRWMGMMYTAAILCCITIICYIFTMSDASKSKNNNNVIPANNNAHVQDRRIDPWNEF